MTKGEIRKQRQAEHVARQAEKAAAPQGPYPRATVAKSRRKRSTRRPVWGSQEWAETRGDDFGPSGDY